MLTLGQAGKKAGSG